MIETTTPTIEQIARDLADGIVKFTLYGQSLHRNDILPDIREALRQACGQQPAVADGYVEETPITNARRNYFYEIAAWLEKTQNRRWAADVRRLANTLAQTGGDNYTMGFRTGRAQVTGKAPDGYKLVPIEPTEKMLKALACLTVLDNEDKLFGLSTYAAMLAVVPTPPVQQLAPTDDIVKLVKLILGDLKAHATGSTKDCLFVKDLLETDNFMELMELVNGDGQ